MGSIHLPPDSDRPAPQPPGDGRPAAQQPGRPGDAPPGSGNTGPGGVPRDSGGAPGLPDRELLQTLVTMPMPFGRYKGTLLYRLPVSYLEWFHREGFPKGKLGMLLATIYEIKINGLDHLLDPLKK